MSATALVIHFLSSSAQPECKHVGQWWCCHQAGRSWSKTRIWDWTLDTMLLVGLVALLLSQKLLATAQPDTSLDSRPILNLFDASLGPTPESSQLVRYVRDAADDSTDYEEYKEQTDQDHIKPGRKKKKKFVEREKEAKRGTRNGRGGENSPQASLFCFKVCNSLIFEVYQLLGGNVCNCDKWSKSFEIYAGGKKATDPVLNKNHLQVVRYNFLSPLARSSLSFMICQSSVRVVVLPRAKITLLVSAN